MTLDQAIEIYDRLRALMPRLEQERIWYRGFERADPLLRAPGHRDRAIPRDRAFCGLATKAARTHAAVRALIEARNADDAHALTRVLIENLVVMMKKVASRRRSG